MCGVVWCVGREKRRARVANREQDEAPAPAPKAVKSRKTTRTSSPSSSSSTSSAPSSPARDVRMKDAASPSPSPSSSSSSPAPTSAPKPPTDAAKEQKAFADIYLRKVAAELADDLDKVREAQDFKASSVPMLVHALRQGESLFSGEEKRRVVGSAGA
jgi:ribosome assembly protein 3